MWNLLQWYSSKVGTQKYRQFGVNISVHPVFHVFLLKTLLEDSSALNLPYIVDDRQECEVEGIADSKCLKYLVRWLVLTWEPAGLLKILPLL